MTKLSTRQVVSVYFCLNQAERSLSGLTSATSTDGIKAFYAQEKLEALKQVTNDLAQCLSPDAHHSPFASRNQIKQTTKTGMHQVVMRSVSKLTFVCLNTHPFRDHEIRHMVICLALMCRFVNSTNEVNFRIVQWLRKGCFDTKQIINIRCGYLHSLQKAHWPESYLASGSHKHYSYQEVLADLQ